MVISGKSGIGNVSKIYSEQTKIGKSAKNTGTNQVKKQDQVVLSPQAQEFGQLLQSLKSVPDVRQDLVKKFEDKISSGNYHVDTKAIADKILKK